MEWSSKNKFGLSVWSPSERLVFRVGLNKEWQSWKAELVYKGLDGKSHTITLSPVNSTEESIKEHCEGLYKKYGDNVFQALFHKYATFEELIAGVPK